MTNNKIQRVSLLLEGLELIVPQNKEDDRGFFSEVWKDDMGLSEFRQMNMSVSKLCTFRGLHYQWDRPQGKLIRVTKGSAIFFELDVRSYSPTFGDHEIIEMSSTKNQWLWVPAGFANGFFSLERDTTIMYMCTEPWSNNEGSINHRILKYPFNYFGSIRNISEKDEKAPSFEDSVEHLQSISEFFRNDSKRIV
jgi:dTDP-4-dehydrorhamnose 3,5-epimerase